MLPPSRRVLAAAGRWLHGAAVHIFPSRCLACERELPRFHLVGACAECWASIRPLFGPTCPRCALPLPPSLRDAGPAAGCCARCVVRPLPLDETVASVLYEATARRFLLRAKDHRRAEILGPLGAQVAVVVKARGVIDRVDVIVPVPSAAWTRWRRGFDPAMEIAREVARRTGLPLLRGALRQRTFSGPAAKTLGAAARWRGAEGRIVVRRAVSGLRILLVDDVLTTGSTAAACASALRKAGAVEIRAAVWARTPAPSRSL
jgi:predicted amidophosphoribosyltransferase